MAKQTKVILIDDIDGGNADETVTFGIDGKNYEIDLSKPHADQLREAIEPFAKSARPSSQQAARRGTRGSSNSSAGRRMSREESVRIRAWARENGHAVSDRGRISAAVQAAYEAAQG